MPFCYNEVNTTASNSNVEESGKSVSNGIRKKDSSSETESNSFWKEFTVVLKPLDITPLLDLKNSEGLHAKNVKIKTNGTAANLDKFFTKCSVKVQKRDLEKLRDTILTGSELNESNMHLKCNICEKVYDSEKKLQNHQQNKHMIIYRTKNSKPQKRVTFSDTITVHELAQYHKCRKCPKIFENYKSLKVHMKLKHRKRKCYICNYCSKEFVDRMFFKVHIKLHCNVCGLLHNNKRQLIEHRRNVCRVVKLRNCTICNETFYKLMDLKDHSYSHTGACFVCDVCKDRCETKCRVAHHISFLHYKQRPTALYSMRNLGSERLYLCNFCEESSVDRDLIESHVATLPDFTNRAMTGYKDYYFCDHCMKKFATETAMLHHKWSHFLYVREKSQLWQNRSPSPNPDPVEDKTKNIKMKYQINEKLPDHLKPMVVLDRIKVGGKVLDNPVAFVDVKSFDVSNGNIMKPVVNPKSKKTIISKYQCQNCSKYYSNNYCLNRHMETQHSDFDKLRCKVCEETFVWPSLLRSHKCIRSNIPEMPFDDARPEIHFDNLHEMSPSLSTYSIDDLNLNIAPNEDYMHSVDFDIPAPIVELHEGPEKSVLMNGGQSAAVDDGRFALHSLGYKVVMQEVPIEF